MRFHAACMLLFIALAPAVASAHPLHTTLTEVRLLPGTGGQVAELRIRAFVDDFSAAVARAEGRRPPRDSSFVVEEAMRYLAATVSVHAGGRRVSLVWCGMRAERGVVWLCLRTTAPVRGDDLSMRQAMHAELYPDQVNLVQFLAGARRVSTLFVAGHAIRKVGKGRG